MGEKKKIYSVIVDADMPKGVKVKEEGGNERCFPDLWAFLGRYAEYLRTPLDTPIFSKPWYHGDVSEDEAESILSGKQPGTFLVRLGDTYNTFFVSYIDANFYTVHIQINGSPEGTFRPQGGGFAEFTDWGAWLKANRHILKYNYDKSGVPSLKIKKELSNTQVTMHHGPVDSNVGDELKTPPTHPFLAGYSCSGYPPESGPWSLICDTFRAEVLNNWVVASVADGCGWGPKSHNAAIAASNFFVDFVKQNKSKFTGTNEAGYLLLKAIALAHDAVVENKVGDAVWEMGTTTLMGGILIPLDEGRKKEDPRFGFILASVGDCKSFVYSPKKKKAFELTLGNRGGHDATDPGGRIGAWVGDGEPDLRNLGLYFSYVEVGDIILMVSDGVHDNLDPQSLGKKPADIGLAMDVPWNKVPWSRESQHLQTQFISNLLEQILQNATTPQQIATALMEYSLRTTQTSRDFMITNPTKKLPADFEKYPGKMDHTTCLCFEVKKHYGEQKHEHHHKEKKAT